MRLIPIESVRPDTVLGKTLYDIEGRVLLKAGVALREKTIEKIKEINILSIYIIDQYSDEEIEDIIKPEIRQKAISTIKEAFSNIERFGSAKGSKVEFSAKDQGYFNNIDKMAENLMDDLLNNKDVLLSLVDIRSMNNYMYSHSVNVAVISLVIGIALKLDRRKLLSLCMGALIHDVGKTLIPKEILTKNAQFTPEEIALLNQHTRLGYKYLSEAYNLNSVSKLIVLQHHERPDGKGYPDGLLNDKIADLSKIVSIADAYDKLSTDRPNQRAMFPSDVLEYLMSNAGKIFDYDIVNIFCRIVIPFPNGTLVKLSTGEIARVEETLTNFPLRPIVSILNSSDASRINLKVNLIKEISIVIDSIVYDM
jgi:HD-GYP domain-containing protein (c-di-GMP phosphodiesterase class II)